MKKKYFTKEEIKIAKNVRQKKYYDKIKKPKLTIDEKEAIVECRKEAREKYVKKYYIENKEKILKYSKNYFIENKEEKLKKNNDRYKKRRNEDPLYKLITNIKRNIRGNIRKRYFVKKSKTVEILGCSFEEFKEYIESKWESWMNWDNYGKYNGELNYGWDLDHIIPSSSAINESDVIELNHHSNLQPLCSHVNRDIKRDNIITVKKDNDISTISIK